MTRPNLDLVAVDGDSLGFAPGMKTFVAGFRDFLAVFRNIFLMVVPLPLGTEIAGARTPA